MLKLSMKRASVFILIILSWAALAGCMPKSEDIATQAIINGNAQANQRLDQIYQDTANQLKTTNQALQEANQKAADAEQKASIAPYQAQTSALIGMQAMTTIIVLALLVVVLALGWSAIRGFFKLKVAETDLRRSEFDFYRTRLESGAVFRRLPEQKGIQVVIDERIRREF